MNQTTEELAWKTFEDLHLNPQSVFIGKSGKTNQARTVEIHLEDHAQTYEFGIVFRILNDLYVYEVKSVAKTTIQGQKEWKSKAMQKRKFLREHLSILGQQNDLFTGIKNITYVILTDNRIIPDINNSIPIVDGKTYLEAFPKMIRSKIEKEMEKNNGWINKAPLLKTLIEMFPNESELTHLYANSEIDPAVRETYYKKSLAVYENPLVMSHFSTLYIQQGRLEEAEVLLASAVQKNPSDPNIHYNMACLYAKRQEVEKMKSELKRSVDLNSAYKQKAIADTDFQEYWEDMDFREIVMV